jgi:hypothetical protein
MLLIWSFHVLLILLALGFQPFYCGFDVSRKCKIGDLSHSPPLIAIYNHFLKVLF